jgi:hypothetical protein
VIDSQNGIPFFTPLALHPSTPIVLLMHHVHQQQFGQYFSPAVAAIGRRLEGTGARWVYGRRAVVAMSPSTRRGTRRELGLRGPIFVVPPGCDVAPATDVKRRPRAPHPTIVCVGRLVPHKRPHLIAEAMPTLLERFPELRLEIVGDGPERQRIDALVDKLDVGHAVTLRGPLDSAARDALLATAWLTVNTSEGEGWALTVVEANAMGVPVFGLRVPGLRDSIRHRETGWLADETADLAQAVAQALDDVRQPDAALAMSNRAVEWSARFNWQATTERIAQIVKSEQGRLQHRGHERRIQSDLTMVVHLPSEVIHPGWSPNFRLTDKVTSAADGISVFLPGTDATSARQALRRGGLPAQIIEDPRVSMSVARPVDYIAPLVLSEPGIDLAQPDPVDPSRSDLDGPIDSRIERLTLAAPIEPDADLAVG